MGGLKSQGPLYKLWDFFLSNLKEGEGACDIQEFRKIMVLCICSDAFLEQ